MHTEERHISREELLLLLDGEMAAKRVSSIETHLLNCTRCSTDLKDVQCSLEQISAVYRADIHRIPTDKGQRSLLRARLQQESIQHAQKWRWSPARRPMIYGAAALLVSALSIGWAHHHAMQKWPAMVQDRPVPNPDLTPGAVRPVNFAEICPAKDDDNDPAVPTDLQQIVFDEYGVAKSTRGREFQVDYLINPQLGGTGEIRNLWPQPYQSTVWNAHAKDALEDRLHTMVCERQVDLAEAQHEIATDWIASYKKHFHAETPLGNETKLAGNATIRHSTVF